MFVRQLPSQNFFGQVFGNALNCGVIKGQGGGQRDTQVRVQAALQLQRHQGVDSHVKEALLDLRQLRWLVTQDSCRLVLKIGLQPFLTFAGRKSLQSPEGLRPLGSRLAGLIRRDFDLVKQEAPSPDFKKPLEQAPVDVNHGLLGNVRGNADAQAGQGSVGKKTFDTHSRQQGLYFRTGHSTARPGPPIDA